MLFRSLEGFLSTDFPDIFTQAITDYRADSETKPKTETKPKEPSQTQKDLEAAKATAQTKKDEEAKAKDKAKQAKVEADKTAQEQAKKAENEKAARQAERRKNATDIVKRNEELRRNRANVDATVEQRFGSVRPATSAIASQPSAVVAAGTSTVTNPKPETGIIPAPPAPGAKPQTFTEGEDAFTRSEKQYAPTPERKAFVAKELKEARERKKRGEELPTDDAVISASTFELKNMRNQPKPLNATQQARANEKKARRQAYLSRFRPEVRENMMTKQEKAERDAAIQQQAEAKAAERGDAAFTNALIPPSQAQIGAGQPQAVVDGRLPNTPENIQKQEAAKRELARLDAQSPVSSPVPITRPQTASYTSQVSSSPIGQNKPSSEMSANVITLDQGSLDGLNNFNKLFDSYVTRLETLEFKPVQHKVEINVAPLQVQITGAAAFEQFSNEMKKIADTLVSGEIGKVETKIKSFISDYPTSGTTGKSKTGK